jgi:ribosome recycling factor
MDPIVTELQGKAEKSIESFENALGKLRSGRANPAILEGLKCDYYGDKIEITSIASVSLPEPRQLLVKPYSRDDLKAIAAGISQANLGINPQVEADAIRLMVPPLTEDTRKDIAKQAKGLSDEAKISIRNVRRDYLDLLKEDETMSDDYKERVEDEIQKAIEAANKKIDEILAYKQKEIMTI